MCRTKVIAHVIDMGASEGRSPIDDYEKIESELKAYDESLANKPQIIIVTPGKSAITKELPFLSFITPKLGLNVVKW